MSMNDRYLDLVPCGVGIREVDGKEMGRRTVCLNTSGSGSETSAAFPNQSLVSQTRGSCPSGLPPSVIDDLTIMLNMHIGTLPSFHFCSITLAWTGQTEFCD